MKAAIIAAALALPLAATAADVTGVVDKSYTYANGWRAVWIVGVSTCPGGPAWYGSTESSADDLSATLRMSKLVGLPVTLTVDTSAGWCHITAWGL